MDSWLWRIVTPNFGLKVMDLPRTDQSRNAPPSGEAGVGGERQDPIAILLELHQTVTEMALQSHGSPVKENSEIVLVC